MPLTDKQRAKFDAICERIAAGELVADICAGDDRPCSENTFYRWVQKDEVGDLQEAYRLAREIQADRWAEETVAIADDARNDWMEKHGKDGETDKALDQEHVQRSRLRIDTRKWIAGKLRPRVYGDRINVDHGLQGNTDIAAIRAEVKQLAAEMGITLPAHITGEAEGQDDEPKDGD